MLGQRIKYLRTATGWSQVDLAKRISVAKQTVSNWENDNIQPSIEMLVRLAKLFNVSTDYLLGLESMRQLNVDGLPENVVAHLSLLIDDYRIRHSQSAEWKSEAVAKCKFCNGPFFVTNTEEYVQKCPDCGKLFAIRVCLRQRHYSGGACFSENL